MCLTYPHAGVRPSDIIAVAMQCPFDVIADTVEDQRFQAQQLTDWFFGMGEPTWLPEKLMYEEVEEEIEEYVDEFGNVIEDYDPEEYEVYEEYEDEGEYADDYADGEYEQEYEEPSESYTDYTGDTYTDFDG